MKKRILFIAFIYFFTMKVNAVTYSNPIYPCGADPCIFKYKDTYYLYCTAETWLTDLGVPVYKSKDLVNWIGPCGAGPYGLALYKNDVWGDKWFWSVDVIEKDGKFYMYASAEQRIIAAVSDSPLGPFTQTVKQPMHSNTTEIDAGILTDDDGKHYIYFSRVVSGEQQIYAAELSDDMLTMKESTITYCFNSQPGTWERVSGEIVEGPSCVKHNGTYYLIYCANPYTSIDYAIGYATSSSPLGPWTKYSGNPILKRNAYVNGPGCGMLVKSPDESEMYMVYHAHKSLTNTNPRKIMLDKAWFEPNPSGGYDILKVNGPTVTPQPTPSTIPVNVSSHTIAFWRLEEGANGSTHSTDLDGYFTDSSGNGNSLSRWYYPAPVSSVPATTIPQTGADNKIALNFCKRPDNAAGGLMCIKTHNKPIDSYAFTNGFTVECIAKNRTYNWNAVVDKNGRPDSGKQDNPFKIIFRYESVGNPILDYEFLDSSTNLIRLDASPYELDKWYWLACVCDGTQAWFYVKPDGAATYTLASHVTGVIGGMIPFTSSWTIGRGGWDNNPNVNNLYGSIDEVRICDYALNINQFLGTSGGTAVSPVAYWRFEEGTNGVHQGNDDDYYIDSSGNGNDMATDIDPVLSTASIDVPFANMPQTGVINTKSRSFNSSIQNIGTFGAETGGNTIDSYNFNSFTIECMAKANSYGWQGILVKDGEPSWNNTGWVDPSFVLKFRNDAVDNRKIQVAFWDKNTNFVECYSSFNYTTGKWYQIAVEYDNNLNELSFYIKKEGDSNYKLQETKWKTATGTPIDGGLINNNYPWAIGRGMHWGQQLDGLDGKVDEVRICDIALQPKNFLGYQGLNVSFNTLAYWKLDNGVAGQEHAGDQDNFYTDYSGNNNNLSTWWNGARPIASSDRPFAIVPQTEKTNKLSMEFDATDDLGTFGAQTGGKMIESYLFTNGWTIECSFKLNSYKWQSFVGKDGQPDPNLPDPIFSIKEMENSKNLVVAFYNNATNVTYISGKTELELGKWYSIAAVLEKNVASLYIKSENNPFYYVDGSAWVENGYAFLGQWNGKNWSVGRGMWDGNATDFVDGKIDEVRICKTPLSKEYFLGSKNIIFPFIDITNNNIRVDNNVIQYTIGGTNNSKVIGRMFWENNANNINGSFIATPKWIVPNIQLEPGINIITINGTNIFGDTSSDNITITRALPEPFIFTINYILIIYCFSLLSKSHFRRLI